MLKHVLMIGAMTIAAPVLAQTAPQTVAPGAPTAATGQAMPASPATTTDAAPTTPQAGAAPADQAAAQPATNPATGSQVAQIVDAEFPTYDANSDGTLNQAEFGTWMAALKAKTDPASAKAGADTKKWVSAAFAQADGDKSKSLTKTELTGFLSQGQS